MLQHRGLQRKPADDVDPTAMTHASNCAQTDPGPATIPVTDAPSSFTAEQVAKRIEKIRSHASSHHTAGTVTLDT